MSPVCVKVSGCQEVILVAMHHTFDKDYRLPTHRELNDPDVVLLVDCLFFEGKGLLACPCNKKAVKMVCKKVITQQVKHSFYMMYWYIVSTAMHET